jgi:hypothetical protein
MGRFRWITLGQAMTGIAIITLIIALVAQSRREAERESAYRAEIGRLRAELEFERSQVQFPSVPGMNMTDL